MEKNRIQIDGVWYVKEDTIDHGPEKELDVTCFEGMVTEDDKYCFEVTRIMRDDGETFYPGVSIKFTNKTSNKIEYWDSDEWLIGVLEADPDSIESASECLDPNGLKLFRQFVSKIKERGWL
jgi:hypothetical protein